MPEHLSKDVLERIKRRIKDRISRKIPDVSEERIFSETPGEEPEIKEGCCGSYNFLMEKLDLIKEKLILVEDLPLYEASWSKVYPKTREERRELYKSKKECFLYYDREQDLPKFPVCDKKGEFRCDGALAAYRRAMQYGYENVAAKAKRVARQHKCDWVEKE